MKLAITSTEALDAEIAACVRLKIQHTALTATQDAEVAAVQKRHAARLGALADEIAEAEGDIRAYCAANRAVLFPDKKSRESAAATVGFEMTPPRVEPANRKIKWGDVVERLKRLTWGKAYLRQAEPKLDKEALLSDREKLTPEQRTAAGITFAQEEQFFLRPKAETAEASATAV